MSAGPDVSALRGHRESAEWERIYFRTRRNRALRRRRLGYFGFLASERILEVGCGDGLNLALLREAGCRRLLGVDISVRLLAHVRGVPVVAGDVFALPASVGALDALLVDSVLHHVVPIKPALAELRRVLRPGGRLCILEPRQTPLRWLMDAAMDVLPFPPPLRARQLTYFEERDRYRAWLRYAPRLPEDLRSAGFEIRQARPLLFGLALECLRR